MKNQGNTFIDFCIFGVNICLPLADYHQITYIDLKKQTLHKKTAFSIDLPSEDQPKTMLSIPTWGGGEAAGGPARPWAGGRGGGGQGGRGEGARVG